MKLMRQTSTAWSRRLALLGCWGVVFALVGIPAAAAQPASVDYVSLAKEGSYVIKNFTFASGETLAELRINYATWGDPKKDRDGNIVNAVLLCHGTMGSWRGFASPWWASKMYGPGQPLDLTRYFVIASDTIGADKSSASRSTCVEGQIVALEDVRQAVRMHLKGLPCSMFDAAFWGERSGLARDGPHDFESGRGDVRVRISRWVEERR